MFVRAHSPKQTFNPIKVLLIGYSISAVLKGLHADHLRYIDGERDDIWGVNNIFHPSIREQALVDALAHPQILDVIASLIGQRLRYHLCTLLVSSERKPYHINWHRDSAPDGEVPLETPPQPTQKITSNSTVPSMMMRPFTLCRGAIDVNSQMLNAQLYSKHQRRRCRINSSSSWKPVTSSFTIQVCSTKATTLQAQSGRRYTMLF